MADLDRYRLGGFLGVMEGASRLGLPGTPGKGLSYTTDAMIAGTPNYSQVLNSILADPSTLKAKQFIEPKDTPWWKEAIGVLTTIGGLFSGNPLIAAGGALSLQNEDKAQKAARARSNALPARAIFPALSEIAPVGQPYTEGGIMFEDLFENVAGFFDTGSWDVDWSSVLDVGTDFASSYFAPSAAVAMPVSAASGPAMRSAAGAIATRGGAVVGRSFFNRFPALAVGIQKLRNAGQRVTRAKLYSMVKKFGPEFVISGGILTAAAVNELMLAGPGHRRMNPANSKALRRSIRRVQSFHRLCKSADVIATGAKRRRCK